MPCHTAVIDVEFIYRKSEGRTTDVLPHDLKSNHENDIALHETNSGLFKGAPDGVGDPSQNRDRATCFESGRVLPTRGNCPRQTRDTGNAPFFSIARARGLIYALPEIRLHPAFLERKNPIMPEPLLECRSLTKRYADREVLRKVSLRLEPGERLAITGPSGSGKTTLLNCLGGIDRPDDGEIMLFGKNIQTLHSDEIASFRRSRIGTIFQFFHLLPTLSVRENVEFPLQLLGWPLKERRERADALLERVHMSHRCEAFPSQVSGGEMQRTAIARALAPGPPLLLADEPTGNLDSANGARVLALLREMTEETGTALVLVTHSTEAAAICHRILRMRDGAVLDETPGQSRS